MHTYLHIHVLFLNVLLLACPLSCLVSESQQRLLLVLLGIHQPAQRPFVSEPNARWLPASGRCSGTITLRCSLLHLPCVLLSPHHQQQRAIATRRAATASDRAMRSWARRSCYRDNVCPGKRDAASSPLSVLAIHPSIHRSTHPRHREQRRVGIRNHHALASSIYAPLLSAS